MFWLICAPPDWPGAIMAAYMQAWIHDILVKDTSVMDILATDTGNKTYC